VKVKCDVHQWMTAYVWVQNNALVAISGDDGSFVMRNVPPGEWTVETWHERFGVRRAKVRVLPGAVARVDFRY